MSYGKEKGRMKKWLLLFLLASPMVARAELVTPQFTQGSMNSTTTTQQDIEEANAVVLADQATKEGIWDIRRSGLQKVADGITSLAEVNRVTVE